MDRLRRNKRQCNPRAFMWVVAGGLIVTAAIVVAFALRTPSPAAPITAAANRRTYEADVQLIGIACGSHLAVEPSYIEAVPGSRITITNSSPWPHELHLSTTDDAVTGKTPANNVLASSPLAPGETWHIDVPGKPGDYYIVSSNPWYHLAGLRAQVNVR